MAKKQVAKKKVEETAEDLCVCCGLHPIDSDEWCGPCLDAGCHEGDGPQCSEVDPKEEK